MKISLVVLIFVAFLIICQDQPEKAIGRPVGTTGNVVGPGYRYNGSLDQQNVPINQPHGRLHEPFKYTSPESWGPMESLNQQQTAMMLNAGSRGRISGIPAVATGAPPLMNDLQPFNLVK